MNNVSDIWDSIKELLSQELTPVAMDAWFKDCHVVDMRNSSITFSTPTPFRRDMILQRFLPQLKKAVFELFSAEMDILVVTEKELEKPAEKNSLTYQNISDLSNYTFEHFIVGSSNKFAHATALAVAEGKTKNYNPLCIWGESGLGKTHLLYAILNEVRSRHPEYNIVYVKGEEFTNELIIAIQSGHNIEFREKYRNADLFLMDDVQFIAGKASTQEEFFHTFNTLYEANKQIVFTSDRPPTEITLLTDRLQSRFCSGMIADINPPDYETRMAIIRSKSTQLGLYLSDEVMDYIAKNVTANVRQIEGAVKRVMAYRDIMDDSIDIAVIKKILSDLVKTENEFIPTPSLIIEETGKYFSVTADDIRSKRKTHTISIARQVSVYLIRKLTNVTLENIGSEFSGRDHSTVLSSIKKVETLMKTDKDLSKAIKDITSNIGSRK